MTERIDAYRPDGQRAGVTFVRGEPIPEGLLHPVVEVLVQHTDGTFLLMERAPEKPEYPGFWEAGAGGSVTAGERFEEAVRRELLEETGLEAENLRELSRNVYPDHRLMIVSYRCDYSGDKEAVTLQAGETSDFRWLNRASLAAVLDSGAIIPPQAARLRENRVLEM